MTCSEEFCADDQEADGGEPPWVTQLRELEATGNLDAVAGEFHSFRERLRCCVELRMDPRLRARVDASDIVQDAMVEAVDRIGDCVSSGAPSLYLWLRYLTIQRLLQERRFHVEAQRRDARRELRLDSASSCAQLAEHLVAKESSPSAALHREERREGLFAVLESLTEDDREILVLRCLEELSGAEVASLLGINESTVSSRFLRALRRARSAFDGESGHRQ